jgi:hypothetical protein
MKHQLTRDYKKNGMQCREYRVIDSEGQPVDRFSVYFAGGVWNAWVSDTFSTTRQMSRRLFAQSLGSER